MRPNRVLTSINRHVVLLSGRFRRAAVVRSLLVVTAVSLHLLDIVIPGSACWMENQTATATFSSANCHDAAYPLQFAGKKTLSRFVEGRKHPPASKRHKSKFWLRVEATSNVYLDNLQNSRQLETTFYVTDTKQLTDFFWYRESGAVRISVGLQNVNVVPVYEDVDHLSDNEYVTSRPGNADEKQTFSNIVRRQCRHPMPDKYSLTLEVLTNQVSRASVDTCSLAHFRHGLCPDGVSFGETFINRTHNKSYTKTAKAQTNADANSIICTRTNVLLKNLFNLSSSPVHEIPTFTNEYRSAFARCDRCLQDDPCQVPDELERRCCQIDCYILPECKEASSLYRHENAKIEYAIGDVYRYTLQPVFSDFRHQFRCHLRRRPLDVLYQVWFYVTLVGGNFETQRIERSVRLTDVGNMATGVYAAADFLSIEHNIGMPLHEELLLARTAHEDISDEISFNNSVFPVTDTDDYLNNGQNGARFGNESTRRFVIDTLSQHRHQVMVQFDKPFSYSYSTWMDRGTDGCDKDGSKFLPVADWNTFGGSKGQLVNVVTQNTGAQFVYMLKALENPPHLKVTIPANTSVLGWWFRDKNTSLIFDESLIVNLTSVEDNKVWEIHVSGLMENCPAYLNIIVNDRLELEELFNHDLLISCPREFNINISIPNHSKKTKLKAFDVIFYDAHRTHRVFLTHISDKEIVCTNNSNSRDGIPGASDKFSDASAVAVVVIVFLCLVVDVVVTISVRGRMEHFRQNMKRKQDGTVNGENGHYESVPCKSFFRNKSQIAQKQKMSIVLYAIFHLAYYILFTFTALSIGFTTLFADQIRSLAEYDLRQSGLVAALHEAQHSIECCTAQQFDKSIVAFRTAHTACDDYIGDRASVIFDKFGKSTNENELFKILNSAAGSVTGLMMQELNLTIGKLQQDLDRVMDAYAIFVEMELRKALVTYRQYIKKMAANPWFLYSFSLFNATGGRSKHGSVSTEGRSTQKQVQFRFNEHDVSFMTFLELYDVESVYLWRIQFYERLNRGLSILNIRPVIQLPDISSCQRPKNIDFYSLWNSAKLENSSIYNRMNSLRYFSTAPISGYNSKWLATEKERQIYTNRPINDVCQKTIGNNKSFNKPDTTMFTSNEITSSDSRINTNWTVVRIVLAALDVIMLVFRLNHFCVAIKKMHCIGFGKKIQLKPSDVLNSTVLKSLHTSFSDSVKTMKPLLLQRCNHLCDNTTSAVNGTSSTYHQSVTRSDVMQAEHQFQLQEISHLTSTESNVSLNCSRHVFTNFHRSKSAQDICRITLLNETDSYTSISRQISLSKLYWRSFCKSSWCLGLAVIVTILLYLQFIVRIYNNVVPSLMLNYGSVVAVLSVLQDHQGHFTSTVYADGLANYYRSNMYLELSHMQGVVYYLNSASTASQEAYSFELCHLKQSLGFDTNCSIDNLHLIENDWLVTMVPCNLLPLMLDYSADCDPTKLKISLKSKSLQVFDSISVIMTSAFNTASLASILFIIFHSAGVVVLRILKFANVFPTHWTYFVSISTMCDILHNNIELVDRKRMTRNYRPTTGSDFLSASETSINNRKAVSASSLARPLFLSKSEFASHCYLETKV